MVPLAEKVLPRADANDMKAPARAAEKGAQSAPAVKPAPVFSGPAMRRTNIYLTVPQAGAVVSIKTHTGLHIADQVRRALDPYFDKMVEVYGHGIFDEEGDEAEKIATKDALYNGPPLVRQNVYFPLQYFRKLSAIRVITGHSAALQIRMALVPFIKAQYERLGLAWDSDLEVCR